VATETFIVVEGEGEGWTRGTVEKEATEWKEVKEDKEEENEEENEVKEEEKEEEEEEKSCVETK
jgi:hypothetical protein